MHVVGGWGVGAEVEIQLSSAGPLEKRKSRMHKARNSGQNMTEWRNEATVVKAFIETTFSWGGGALQTKPLGLPQSSLAPEGAVTLMCFAIPLNHISF